MAEIEEIKELVNKMAQEIVKQKQDINRLIAALAEGRHAPLPDAAALRLDKLAKMSLALRKSSKVKDFKDNQKSNIRVVETLRSGDCST